MRSGRLKVAGAYSVSRGRGVRRTEVRGASLLLLQDVSVPAPDPEERRGPTGGGAKRVVGLLSLFATVVVAACGATRAVCGIVDGWRGKGVAA
jgi:hypothetical protein